jgi:transcriptional regulator with PAS, ATPase and Fis domain
LNKSRFYSSTYLNCLEPVAHIVLGRDTPAELVRLLPDLGIEVSSGHSIRGQELAVEFIGLGFDQSLGSNVLGVRSVIKLESSPFRRTDIISSDPRAVATLLLSYALALPSPIMTSDEATFSAVRAAVASARTFKSVLIEGETGTGKELVARLLHAASPLRERPLRCINCAGVNENHLEWELFAPSPDDESEGPGEGIILLDQVAELSVPSQARVAGKLRQNDCAPTGLAASRYIATSNVPLAEMVACGTFDPELYRELSAVRIVMPPLRSRPTDIPLLAKHFLRAEAPNLHFSQNAMAALTRYSFPGNVRELRNVVTCLAILPPPGHRVIEHEDIAAQLI